MQRIERMFEWIIWHSRLVMLLPVVALLMGSVYFAVQTVLDVWQGLTHRTEALTLIVGAVDSALLAAVLVLFGLGLYELFVSKIDLAEGHRFGQALVIDSLDELKTKLGQVVLMILVVKFFEKALAYKLQNPLDLVYFAGGVALLALSLWLVRREH